MGRKFGRCGSQNGGRMEDGGRDEVMTQALRFRVVSSSRRTPGRCERSEGPASALIGTRVFQWQRTLLQDDTARKPARGGSARHTPCPAGAPASRRLTPGGPEEHWCATRPTTFSAKRSGCRIGLQGNRRRDRRAAERAGPSGTGRRRRAYKY